MIDFLINSSMFGVALSLVAFWIGLFVRKKTGLSILSPLVTATAIIIVFLVLTGIEYETYDEGASLLRYFLTPATVCLAIPLYQKLQMLKDNFLAIMAGIVAGVLVSALSILAMCLWFNFDHQMYVTLLPKSITTAIGISASEELGGIVALTTASIIITGNVGGMFAEVIFKLFGIKEPISKGLALGTGSHVMGTSKAMEIGELEGAMGSLAIAVAGVITVVVLPIFAEII
ncbi:MAG: LrgB family protein [Lachnospiraceae bacterium]|nr:LrgB family protein [Lachnospiraceae bacterium]